MQARPSGSSPRVLSRHGDFHPIFDDMENGDLEAVKAYVLTDAAVLDARDESCGRTPLMYAIKRRGPGPTTLPSG